MRPVWQDGKESYHVVLDGHRPRRRTLAGYQEPLGSTILLLMSFVALLDL